MAECQGVGTQQQHRAHDLAWERRPDTRGVTLEQPLLELPGVPGVDEGRGQRAEAGRHAIDHLTGLDELLDDVPGRLDPLSSRRVEHHPGIPPGHPFHIRDGQTGTGQQHRCRVGRGRAHGSSIGMRTPRSRATWIARS